MNKQLLTIFLLAGIFAVTGCEKGEETAEPGETTATMAEDKAVVPQEKLSIMEEALVTMEATVTAINHETREVTLQNAEGESVTIIADDEVKNLAQVDVGDKLTIEYMEGVMIQVFGSGEVELGTEEVTAVARAEPGEKPAGVAITETTVIVVIEAIDKENEKVTLKNAEGKSRTVKVRNPDNLEKVAVGDKVIISFTKAVAITITEK